MSRVSGLVVRLWSGVEEEWIQALGKAECGRMSSETAHRPPHSSLDLHYRAAGEDDRQQNSILPSGAIPNKDEDDARPGTFLRDTAIQILAGEVGLHRTPPLCTGAATDGAILPTFQSTTMQPYQMTTDCALSRNGCEKALLGQPHYYAG